MRRGATSGSEKFQVRENGLKIAAGIAVVAALQLQCNGWLLNANNSCHMPHAIKVGTRMTKLLYVHISEVAATQAHISSRWRRINLIAFLLSQHYNHTNALSLWLSAYNILP